MAIFRVEKNKNYTVMSNHHLRDKNISLKAKGLLSEMLSLPDDWDYTLSGLAVINKENVDAIRSAVNELEKNGYITRQRTRYENGTLGGIEYIIHEEPLLDKPTSEKPMLDEPTSEKPLLDEPTSENPMLDDPMLEEPILENPRQINTNILNTNIPSTKSSSSGKKPEVKERMKRTDEQYMQIVADNIGLQSLMQEAENETVKQRYLMLFEIICKVVCSKAKSVRINSEDVPIDAARSVFLQIGYEEIGYVCMKLDEPKDQPIHNLESYIRTLLYNARTTVSEYWTQKYQYDYFGGGAAELKKKQKKEKGSYANMMMHDDEEYRELIEMLEGKKS